MDHYEKLLVFTGTEQSENAINRAAALAIENRASLTLMDVIKPIPRALGLMTDVADPDAMEKMMAEDRKRQLLEIASEYSDTAISINVVVRIGSPATEIIREVLRNGHDLVIKTADGLSGAGRLQSSLAKSLLRMCPCSLLLLRPCFHGEFDQVLAAIDVDATDKAHQSLNESILELSLAISRTDNAKLHLVAAWDYPMEAPLRRRAGDAEVDAALARHDREVRQVLEELKQSQDVGDEDAEVHVQRGSAAAVIQHMVDEVEADLLVMGTVCRTGITGFLIGNTAESVLSNVHCSVLALKPEGFVCPIAETPIEHAAT